MGCRRRRSNRVLCRRSDAHRRVHRVHPGYRDDPAFVPRPPRPLSGIFVFCFIAFHAFPCSISVALGVRACSQLIKREPASRCLGFISWKRYAAPRNHRYGKVRPALAPVCSSLSGNTVAWRCFSYIEGCQEPVGGARDFAGGVLALADGEAKAQGVRPAGGESGIVDIAPDRENGRIVACVTLRSVIRGGVKRIVPNIILGILSAGSILAQTAAPQFEVASVRARESTADRFSSRRRSGERRTWHKCAR
jgi:hypothetical protein